MRSARLVGLSQDGRSLIVATDDGEELAVLADDRLRAAVRGDRPRLGQLEIEMESSLSPRDIQMRIRAGEALEDVARVAGIPLERVERFAAPVLAEREHVASQAMSSSVRRRGETSGHRSLRVTVTERLLARGVDIDTIAWDSHRLEDGHWEVTADYRSGEAARHASFVFDVRGRFSVAGNDEAKWLLGEHSAARGPQPGRRRGASTGGGEDDTEPTLDLSDELALVRATQETPPEDEPGLIDEHGEPAIAAPRMLHPLPAADDRADRGLEVEEEQSPLGTLYEMLGGDGYSEDSPRVYAGLSGAGASDQGLSDATAVPDTGPSAGWEPAIVVNYPVEPSQSDEEDSAQPEDDGGAEHLPGTDEPGPPDRTVNLADRTEEDREFEAEAEAAAAAPAAEPTKPARRKRASVPSWDEIMFGGPKRP